MASILFNDLICFRSKSGVGHYASQVLTHLPVVAPDIPLTRISDLAGVGWIAEAMARKGHAARGGSKVPSGVKAAAQSALHFYLSQVSRQKKWALFHEPDNIAFPVSAPTVASIMDLSVVLHPDWHPLHRVIRYEDDFRDSLERSIHFLAISEATKGELMKHYGIDGKKISAVPLAPREEFREVSQEDLVRARERWKLPASYFLFVGNLEPRKNLLGLLRAYALLSPKIRASHPLFLVGGWGWKSQDLNRMLSESPWRENVRHLGYVMDSDLAAITKAATALVYPSFYEGFGLPPLEAMAAGTPVIASRIPGLFESVGEAALTVNPNDFEAIAEAMKRVAEEKELRESLSVKGLKHSAKFSWQETAKGTAEVYRRLLAQ